MNRQVHGATVTRAEPGQRGRDGDGLWTDEPGVPMLEFTADCLPIALARVNGTPGLALLHAGRLGLLDGVVEAGVARARRTGSLQSIGPGIGPCCYEVGDEVAAAVSRAIRSRRGARTQPRPLDRCERVLRSAGVESVERLDLCTACNPEQFFSHRRDGPVTGRQGVIGYVA